MLSNEMDEAVVLYEILYFLRSLKHSMQPKLTFGADTSGDFKWQDAVRIARPNDGLIRFGFVKPSDS